jgi:hypothetical protein
MANAKGRTRDVNAAQRATLALQLRTQGQTYEQIAQTCGYASRGACHDAIQRELSRVVVENVDELRREQLVALDRLQDMCWGLAKDPENKGRLFAVDRILQILERRAKLMGLDAKPDALPDGTTIIREYSVEVSQV